MRKKRTFLTCVSALAFPWAIGCGGEELANCDEITGMYHPELTFLAEMVYSAEPGACSGYTLEELDLSIDDHTLNTGTSSLNTRVERRGCDLQVTYTETIQNPGDPDDHSGSVLRNNDGTRYLVGDGAVFSGEAVYVKYDRMRQEMCRGLYLATWFPYDAWLEMQQPAP